MKFHVLNEVMLKMHTPASTSTHSHANFYLKNMWYLIGHAGDKKAYTRKKNFSKYLSDISYMPIVKASVLHGREFSFRGKNHSRK